MAIDDNTSYELTGAQVKDLAARIRDNTTLAKNLAGGADKTSKLVYMTAITGTDALRIAEEIDPQQASASMVTSLMKYRFYNAETGEEYNDLGDIQDIVDTDLGLIEFVQTPSDNSNYPVVKMVESAAVRYDAVADTVYLDITLKVFDKSSLAIKTENVTFGPDTQYNLYWYKAVSEETLIGQARGYVQRITPYQTKIADEINASLPSDTPAGEYISTTQVGSFMEYAFFAASGNLLKTTSDIRTMLTRNTIKGPLVFVPTQGNNDTGWSLASYSWSGSASSGSGGLLFFDSYDRKEKNFIIRPVDASQYDDGRKHAWYEVSYDDTYEFQYSGGYANSGYPVDPSTETPEFTYQLAYDQSDNLYIAANTSSTSDWKQVNNDAIVSFTGTDGTAAGTAGLVPAPSAADTNKYLKSDGTWATVSSGTTWAGEKVFYGTCSTYYYTSAKAVSTSFAFVYEEGVVLFVKFANYHTNSSFTLNVNSTGAKTVYKNGDSSSNGDYMWKANDIVGFVYDGTYWRMIDSDRATSSYWGKVKLASSYTSSSSDTVPTSSHLYSVYNIANNKQDQLIAGQGISISGNTISATNAGSTYTYSGAVDTTNNSFTTTITDSNSVAQNVTLNAGSNIAFSSSTALGKVGPTIVPNTTASYYADITSLTFTPTNANLGYFFVLRVYKEYQMATSTNMYQATLYSSNTTYSYSSAAEVSEAINNEQIIINPDFMAFSNYFTQVNQSSFQSDAATAISQVSGVPANFGGTIDAFGQATYVDVYVYVLNESAFTISATGGSGGGAVTYYMTSGTTQGIPSYQTYIYSDAARTTVVDPDTILAAYESGNTILLKYESTQTGSSAYDMTLQVNSMSLVGEDGYKMLVSELNEDNGNYNAVNTLIQATWDGIGTFSGRWVLVRNIYNKSALIIREWS